MSNWKTTLTAIIGALSIGLSSQFPEIKPILDGISAVAIALLGYFAKDKETK